MKSKICAKATVIAILAMLTIGVSPLALAVDKATGGAEAGNVAPEVTSVTTPSQVDPQGVVNFPCTVQDNNTLADIDNVVLKVYHTSVSEGSPDNIVNHYTFWFYPVDNTWHETGPDPAGSHINTETCIEPGVLTVQYDNYSFAIILSGAATAGGWTAKWIATDDNGASGDNTGTFTVNEYIALAISPTTQTFSGDPGDTGLTASENEITCTVTANVNFNIKTGLAADWIGTTHSETIGAANTHADNGVGSINLSSAENQIVWENVPFGEDVTRDIIYTLDLPSPLRDDVYTTTFHVQAVKAP